MEDKWRTAWSLFDEDKGTPIEYRSHAWCWLTYRATEGHISREEYQKRVWLEGRIPPSHPDAARWITAQAAAEFYLWTLWDQPKRAMAAANTVKKNWKKYPPNVLSMLRITAVLAYKAYLDGKKATAKKMIQNAINGWQKVMAKIDWRKFPTRFLDGRGDMVAIHALMCIANHMKMLPYDVETYTVSTTNEPWVKCLKHTSKREVTIWT